MEMPRILGHLLSMTIFLVTGTWGAFAQTTDQFPTPPALQTPPQSMPADLGAEDKSFLIQAAEANLAETLMGQMAEQRSNNPVIRRFAAQMVRDHGQLLTEVRELASTKGLALPYSIDNADDAAQQNFSSLSGNQFDSAYMSLMVKDHNRDVAQFDYASNHAADPQVQHFAASVLPVLQSHLSEAEQIEGGATIQ